MAVEAAPMLLVQVGDPVSRPAQFRPVGVVAADDGAPLARHQGAEARRQPRRPVQLPVGRGEVEKLRGGRVDALGFFELALDFRQACVSAGEIHLKVLVRTGRNRLVIGR